MKKTPIFLLLIVIVMNLGLIGCNNNGGFQTTSSGIQYKFLKQNKTAPKIKQGVYVDFHMLIKNAQDSVVEDSYKKNTPYKGQLFPEVKLKGDLLEAFTLMAEGDSAIVKLSTDSLLAQNRRRIDEQINQLKSQLKQQPAQTADEKVKKQIQDNINSQITYLENEKKREIPELPKGKFYTYIIKVLSVKNEEQMRKEQQEAFKKQQEEAAAQNKKDVKEIQAYLEKNKLTAKSSSTGLHYVVEKEGDGIAPQAGDTVRVQYTGMLLNGKIFDTSLKEVAEKNKIFQPQRPYEPLTFVVGVRQMIPGFDEGVGYLKTGGKARLFIPSGLGYGPRAQGQEIPANSILVFDIELLEVKPAKKVSEDKPVK